MRVPIRHLAGNLAWTVHGGVWAIWRVTPHAYTHAGDRAKNELHAATTAVLKGLPGEAMLLSLCAQVDPAGVVEQMIHGVDLDEHPGWAETAEAALDLLCELDLNERSHWLAVPLHARRFGLGTAAASLITQLGDPLGLAPPPVPAHEADGYAAQAAALQAQLPGPLQLRAALPAEVLWIFSHATHRGLAEPLLSQASGASGGQAASTALGGLLRGPCLAWLGQVRITEGGKDGNRGGLLPLRRRWLEVETGDGVAYQAFLTLAEMPAAFRFPGAEHLAHLDDFNFPVDYAVRLQLVGNAEAEAKARRKARELAAQVEEYDDDTAGVPQSLVEAAAELDDERGRLQGSATEVEAQSATTLCVWGQSPEQAEARAELVRTTMAAFEYQVVRPTGAQRHLFAAMLPGAPSPPQLREFTQYQLAEDFAMAMPWASSEVGDPTGMLLGLSLDGGAHRPVLLDLANAPRADASASLGAVGELGAGKSVALKSILIALLDRGGTVLAVDRTPMGEWAAFAEAAAPEAHQIIRAGSGAGLSLDPLRIFPRETAGRYAKSYLTLQLGVAPMSPAGLVLAQAVDAALAGTRPSMRNVIDELDTVNGEEHGSRRGEHAAELADLLRAVAADPLAEMIFGDLPALRLGGDIVVFHTAGLTLPKKEIFTSEYHMARQPLETLIGRAVLYVIAAVAREVAFADPGRFCGIALDECYWLTSSNEGQDLAREIVRDGRKHAAGALLGSHDPDDFGDETIRGLLGNRFLLRHRDTALAAKGLEFLNLDPSDPGLLDLVTSDLSPVEDAGRHGEALYLDTRRRAGRIRVLIPGVERIASSILTTPGHAAAGDLA